MLLPDAASTVRLTALGAANATLLQPRLRNRGFCSSAATTIGQTVVVVVVVSDESVSQSREPRYSSIQFILGGATCVQQRNA